MHDHARDRALPTQTGRGHLEVSLDSFASTVVTMMFNMLASMRLDFVRRTTMTNTLAWNLTLSEQPQYDKPRLTLLVD